jgi:hypothetical protein
MSNNCSDGDIVDHIYNLVDGLDTEQLSSLQKRIELCILYEAEGPELEEDKEDKEAPYDFSSKEFSELKSIIADLSKVEEFSWTKEYTASVIFDFEEWYPDLMLGDEDGTGSTSVHSFALPGNAPPAIDAALCERQEMIRLFDKELSRVAAELGVGEDDLFDCLRENCLKEIKEK